MRANLRIRPGDVITRNGEFYPLFPIERTRDALAAYCAVRWPNNRAKMIAREWDLSHDDARSVLSANASQYTIDRIFRHPAGGWAVVLPVFGALLNEPVQQFLSRAQENHDRRTALPALRRAPEMVGRAIRDSRKAMD